MTPRCDRPSQRRKPAILRVALHFDNEFAEVARSDERARLTTGGKPKLLGISKRGNVYLRKMLIHGARAALPTLSKGETPLGRWLSGLLARAHLNTVVVALAAKLARIIWAVLRSGRAWLGIFDPGQPLSCPRSRACAAMHTASSVDHCRR
jgi:hypothetical protein